MIVPTSPEPWLQGPLPGVHPAVAAVLRALEQVTKDLPHFTEGLRDVQVWAALAGESTIGFQLRHIAGSVDRLTTYLRGEQLNDKQLRALKAEHTAGATLAQLLAEALDSIAAASEVIHEIPDAEFGAVRFVGRAQLPVTAIGLAIHIAEHTQRHTGQLILLCRIAR